MSEQTLYALKIVATGEVRDSEGNLLNTVPIETTQFVTEEEALAIIERANS